MSSRVCDLREGQREDGSSGLPWQRRQLSSPYSLGTPSWQSELYIRRVAGVGGPRTTIVEGMAPGCVCALRMLFSAASWRPTMDEPERAPASLAILQTGLLSHWLWSSTVKMVVVPNTAAGYRCSFFGVLQSGDATRSTASHSPLLRDHDFAAESEAFRHAMQRARGRVAALVVVPPLEALNSTSWLPFSVQWPGPLQNFVRKQHLLDVGMREVLLDATPFEWVLWIREDAGWWAPLSIGTVHARSDCCSGIVFTTACADYGLPDKAWLADRRTMATVAAALFHHVLQAGNGAALLVDASGGARRDAVLQLGRVAAVARARQAGADGPAEFIPRTEMGRFTNSEHVVMLVMKAHGIRYATPVGKWNSTTGAMVRFGLPVSDARRTKDGRVCLRPGAAGGFHGQNELLTGQSGRQRGACRPRVSSGTRADAVSRSDRTSARRSACGQSGRVTASERCFMQVGCYLLTFFTHSIL